MDPQYLPLLHIKYVCCEAPVRPEHLPCQRGTYAVVPFGDIPDRLALSVHDDISVGLLKAQHDVHYLQLPLDDQAAIAQDGERGMVGAQYAVRIVGYAHFGDEIGGIRLCECSCELGIASNVLLCLAIFGLRRHPLDEGFVIISTVCWPLCPWT